MAEIYNRSRTPVSNQTPFENKENVNMRKIRLTPKEVRTLAQTSEQKQPIPNKVRPYAKPQHAPSKINYYTPVSKSTQDLETEVDVGSESEVEIPINVNKTLNYLAYSIKQVKTQPAPVTPHCPHCYKTFTTKMVLDFANALSLSELATIIKERSNQSRELNFTNVLEVEKELLQKAQLEQTFKMTSANQILNRLSEDFTTPSFRNGSENSNNVSQDHSMVLLDLAKSKSELAEALNENDEKDMLIKKIELDTEKIRETLKRREHQMKNIQSECNKIKNEKTDLAEKVEQLEQSNRNLIFQMNKLTQFRLLQTLG